MDGFRLVVEGWDVELQRTEFTRDPRNPNPLSLKLLKP